MRQLLFLLVAASMLPGCRSGAASPTSDGPVSLVVPLDHQLFADGAVLSIAIWNAGQLAALAGNSQCAVVRDPVGGATQVQCPPGVTFKDVTPEQFELPLSSLGATVEVTARSIAAGETFRIRLSALGSDRCNATSADAVREASPGRTVLGGLEWRTTLLGCVVPPPR